MLIMIVPNDTRYYIKVFENVIDKKLCNKVIKQLKGKDIDWSVHTWNVGYSKDTGENINTQGSDHELSIVHHNSNEADLIMKNLYAVLDGYYNIVLHKFHWFNGWEGFSYIRFNKYEVDTEMALHCDHIKSLFTGTIRGIPVLTILGALNENYEGGNLIIGNEEIKLKTGSVVVFPSNFMYPHEVKRVIKGTRYSYVSWVW